MGHDTIGKPDRSVVVMVAVVVAVAVVAAVVVGPRNR